MPRPTKLTPALQRAMVTAVTAGVPLPSAAALAGVDYSTVKDWLQRGFGTRRGRASSALYVSFASSIVRAQAEDEARRVARLEQAGRGGAVIWRKTTTYPDGRVVTEERVAPPAWQADAWYLERARWQTWGKKDRQDLHLHIHEAAKKVAEKLGLTPEAILVEAEALLKEIDHDQV